MFSSSSACLTCQINQKVWIYTSRWQMVTWKNIVKACKWTINCAIGFTFLVCSRKYFLNNFNTEVYSYDTNKSLYGPNGILNYSNSEKPDKDLHSTFMLIRIEFIEVSIKHFSASLRQMSTCTQIWDYESHNYGNTEQIF